MTTNSDKMTNKFKKIIENLEEKTDLSLKRSNVGDDDAKSLAEALRNTQITYLDLSHNKIGSNGLKYLADVLKDTQINNLNLSYNNVLSEGVKYLAKLLKDTKIRKLDLSENKIGFEAAEYLNELVRSTSVESLFVDVFCVEDGIKYFSQRSYSNINNVHIELERIDIGVAGSKYINTNFNKTGIIELKLNFPCWYFNKDEVHNLAEAFRNVNISCLHSSPYFEYLIEIFEKSQIGQLYLDDSISNVSEIHHLAKFLKQIKILELTIRSNHLNDESIKILAPALKKSDIMILDISSNYSVSSDGAKYLSEILQDSNILFIGLCNCAIGTDGAKYLAYGLRHSQVTGIHLHGNNIGYEGYQALINVADDTNISWVNLHCNNIEKGMNGEKLWPYSIPRKNYLTMADKIEFAFKEIVKLDSENNEYEFILPNEENSWYCSLIDKYAFLIGTLKNTPNSKVHLYQVINGDNTQNDGYNFVGMKRIDEFIANITDKFISFIESNLPNLINKFADADYVNLVKQFEELNLHDIVQNLLLHRVLYYIDENQEILHPYIYKLLHQYSLPLYNSQLEPNKKDKIISYYESHQDIDGVQEIIDLLKSSSL